MTDQNGQSGTENSRLAEILNELTITQIRFVIARNETKSDKEAAELIGISPSTVKNWDNKSTVDEAIKLMLFDGVITAKELRRNGRPFGDATWTMRIANRLGLHATLRPRGRPRRAAGATR